MKKIISWIIGFSVIICMLGSVELMSFAAEQTEDIEKTQLGSTDTYYSYDADSKTLTISGNGSTPDFRNDSASQPWYLWRGSIGHVVVEEGVTEIGDYFFYNVRALDFELPSTLVSIGRYAMSQINSASSIVLPEGLVTIEDYAFYFSMALESVNIPSTVTSIGTSAFENCTALESVTFDDLYSDVSIGRHAFLRCARLNRVTVPKRASVLAYALGFEKASRGWVYDDFIMNVYRDSPAYTYAVNNIVHYNIINEMEIVEGQHVDCTYYIDSYRDEMIFIFTPQVSDFYSFYSTGEVDIDCTFNDVLYDDNSLDDLNFTVSSYLEAGQAYYFTVNCVSQMSLGDFTVHLTREHQYDSVVTPPTLTQDGYTTYTCRYCGYSYKADFVSRTGVRVTGRVVLMESPDGSHENNLPVIGAVLSVGESNLTLTDSNGEFEFYVQPTEEKLCIGTAFSVDRIFDITVDADMEMNLGDVCLINFDYNRDGYINAKDFAVLRGEYGEYSPEDKEIYAAFDCNGDGTVNDDDFSYARNFLTYGRITESIYD